MSDEKQLDKRLEKCWQIHKVLCDCESIDFALNAGVPDVGDIRKLAI